MSQPASKSASALGGGVVVQKAKSGVYTVMLALTLLCITLGCVFLYLEIAKYQAELPSPPPVVEPAAPVDEAPAEGAPAEGEAAPAEGEAAPAEGKAAPAEGEAAPAGDAPAADAAPME